MAATDSPRMKHILITGGSGFIGLHTARRVKATTNRRIRIVDKTPLPKNQYIYDVCHEFVLGDLLDYQVCKLAVQDVDIVLHFAANMGGMGTIHQENDTVLYTDNHTMSVNMIQAAKEAGVSCFFYASSACVYPDHLQSDTNNHDVSLREPDAYVAGSPPLTQGFYGLEKLHTENLLHNISGHMQIRIARFHNIYGPGGSWNNGREKAPAAMLRKACALKRLLPNDPATFEIWGDGKQRRSFLYIDDAVDGILKLLDSEISTPVNIGSDTAITISELAKMSIRLAGMDPGSLKFSFNSSQPVGVASRNSNNDKVRTELQWTPSISLEAGMRQTMIWIDDQVAEDATNAPSRDTALHDMLSSKKLHLCPRSIMFGILLPITSSGSGNPEDCLNNLRRFAKSLVSTTRSDTRLGSDEDMFSFRIYLAVDEVDVFLLPQVEGTLSPAERVLREELIADIKLIRCDHPRGHVCNHWRDCAALAYEDQCDYMVLMGDDVVLEDEGWMRKVHAEFKRIASQNNVPIGFGCVAFTDVTFPGMPTFPVVSRIHMQIFDGKVVPDIFVNQDGDPFLFQLYRRWNCSTMISSRLSNGVGGASAARYEKVSATNWTFKTLTDATSTVAHWLRQTGHKTQQSISLDIVIPCYRVNVSIINTIVALKPSNTCAVMFIIIVDDPTSPYISILEQKYSRRPDIRIRVNKTNLGASASRNRGMKESAADWVHFLDDDVVPADNLLLKDEEIIRAHPSAAGFVGTTLFPRADTIFTTAVHLAGVTYFWDIAAGKLDSGADIPWGVTANLIARRSVPDGVQFNLLYPKTGGGEDIHFCREKRDASLRSGRESFYAAPDVKVEHPWWNNGKRSYWRFYNWSVGDGALIKQFPQHTYRDFAPNSAEWFLFCFMGIVMFSALGRPELVARLFWALLCIFTANILHDCYRHFIRHPERNINLNSRLQQRRFLLHWMLAVIESSLIRQFSECGRLRGVLARAEYSSLGKRFDWFTDRCGAGPRTEERLNNVQRSLLALILYTFFTILAST